LFPVAEKTERRKKEEERRRKKPLLHFVSAPGCYPQNHSRAVGNTFTDILQLATIEKGNETGKNRDG